MAAPSDLLIPKSYKIVYKEPPPPTKEEIEEIRKQQWIEEVKKRKILQQQVDKIIPTIANKLDGVDTSMDQQLLKEFPDQNQKQKKISEPDELEGQ